MDGITVSVVRDRGRVLLVLGAVVAVAAPWFLVARKLGDAHPPATPTLHATALVWGGRVFTSPVQFAGWLRSRGSSYTAWKRKHSQLTFGTAAQRAAAARSDKSTLAAKAKKAKRHTAAPSAKHQKAAQVAAPSRPSGKLAAAAKAKRPTASSSAAVSHSATAGAASQHAPSASGAARGSAAVAADAGRTGHALEVVFLLLGCFVVLAGMGAPAALRLVQPHRWTIPFEARLLAVATGVSLALAGVLAGGFL
jgi:cytoskeletal protein RodZ